MVKIMIEDRYSRTFQGIRPLVQLSPQSAETVGGYLLTLDSGFNKSMPLDMDAIDEEGEIPVEYQCPLCTLYARIIVPSFRIKCGHTFCACCMLKHLQAKAEEPSRMRSGTGSAAPCPLCKRPIRSPPSTNFFARDAVLMWSRNLGIRPRTDVNVKVDYMKACEIAELFFVLV
ncbi:hypothetical protein EV421DRAFT_1737808 [Armillaria borealis]|uniref:RING-type domain-containing protein n=1 Tax=Armillaria borealis TaxID=47425 RepID=A0AA39JC66_9AGAR|nr:hypothetical protein EV421DRAFT_1737808 [Armillaria borealis]